MYFDHAATSPLSQGLKSQLKELIELAGYNPSSSHKKGLEVRRALEDARETLASFLGADSEEIFFTSSATESNNLILQGLARGRKGHIISSAVEHDSVEKTLKHLEEQGIEVTRLEPSRLTTDEVISEIRKDTFLVSLIMVQNESGDIYPLEGLGDELDKRGIYYHRDLVQALAKVDFSLSQDYIDLASFSSHKLGGLKGLGMVYKKKGLELAPLMYGGDQEKQLRPGTENTLAILLLGELIKEMDLDANKRIRELNHFMRKRIQAMGGRIISQESASPYILAASFSPPAEVFLTALSMKGVYASAGSACHARSKKIARIAKFIDKDLTAGMIRLSLSSTTSLDEVEKMLDIVEETHEELKRYL